MRIAIGKFTKILVAVLGGNALYYFFEDRLPAIFRHKIFAMDWGLFLDFWICVLLWLILDLAGRLRLRYKK